MVTAPLDLPETTETERLACARGEQESEPVCIILDYSSKDDVGRQVYRNNEVFRICVAV